MATVQDITALFNVPTTGALLSSDNTGSTLDFTAGSPSGSQTIPTTGNSLLDSIASFSALAVNEVSKGLSAYSGYLESSAVANAANKLNTTPTMVSGALATVPLTTAQVTAQQDATQKLFLYGGLAALAVVIVVVIAKRK